VASTLVSKLPPCPKLFDFNSDIFKQFYKSVLVNNLHLDLLSPVTEDFIFSELEKLNPNKSTGLDNIPARFLKDGACVLQKPITYLVNLSISSGVVPEDMKIARVCPIFKKNSRLDVVNYRPISILIIISKILEKTVYLQLEKYTY
jgi:hypothetical protein